MGGENIYKMFSCHHPTVSMHTIIDSWGVRARWGGGGGQTASRETGASSIKCDRKPKLLGIVQHKFSTGQKQQ